jgi:hypothetical protein
MDELVLRLIERINAADAITEELITQSSALIRTAQDAAQAWVELAEQGPDQEVHQEGMIAEIAAEVAFDLMRAVDKMDTESTQLRV